MTYFAYISSFHTLLVDHISKQVRFVSVKAARPLPSRNRVILSRDNVMLGQGGQLCVWGEPCQGSAMGGGGSGRGVHHDDTCMTP